MSRRIRVLWNPGAGSTAEGESMRASLRGRPDVDVVETSSKTDTERFAAEAAEDGVDLVVAAGGDGTVSDVARGLVSASQPVPLAILPLGTANDLSRTLATDDASAAVALWDAPDLRPFDAVRVDAGERRSWFFNVATGGNSARVHDALTDEVKRRWGAWCYVRGALDVVSDLETYRVVMRVDDSEPRQFDALTVVLGNARFAAGGIAVAPRADPGDGLLDVVVVCDGPPLDLAVAAAHMVAADYTESDLAVFQRGRRVELSSEPPMGFTLDGEPLEAAEVVFTVVPGALRVVVGPGYTDAVEPGSGR